MHSQNLKVNDKVIRVGKFGELVVTERASVLSEMRPGPVRCDAEL